MGIFSFFKSKKLVNIITSDSSSFEEWNNALDSIDDQEILKKLALNLALESRQLMAIEKVSDQHFLSSMANNTSNRACIRAKAIQGITDQEILIEFAIKDQETAIQEAAIRKIENQESLQRIIANNSINWSVRETAVKQLSDQTIIFDIAQADTDHRIRETATSFLLNEQQLIKIAKSDKDWTVRLAALRCDIIKDQNVLKDIASNDEEPLVRKTAQQQIG